MTKFGFGFGDDGSKYKNYTELLIDMLGLKTLKKVTIDCEFEEDTLRVLSNLKVCNPAVDTLVLVKPLLDADLKIFPKFFPNVTDLEITWFSNSDEDHVGWDFFDYSFEMDLSPINSMKQIRKF